MAYSAAKALLAAARAMPVLIVIDDFFQCEQLVQIVAKTLVRALAGDRTGRPAAGVVIAGITEDHDPKV